MRVYQCDSCKKVIKDPYEEKMKEFFYSATFDFGTFFPVRDKSKKTVHLCDKCYRGLHLIAEGKRSGDK